MIADDLISRCDTLAADRSAREAEWREIADYFLPTASQSMRSVGSKIDAVLSLPAPSMRETAHRRYDDTAIWALDRLASGIESLVTPQSQKWHGLAPDDLLAPEPTDAETAWFERVRDFLFACRYEPRSGFATSNQKAIRSTCAFGTAVMFCEEAWGRDRAEHRLPFVYRFLPLMECYLAQNAQGEVDTNFRRFTMTARQMRERFGDKCPDKVKAAWESDRDKDKPFVILHAVFPREEAGSSRGGSMRKARYASFYIEAEARHVLGESGFHEFPFVIYHWLQGENAAYGESPAMMALDTVRGLNAMKKTGLRAMQQFVDPPLAVSHDGVMNRPNLNPRAINFGAVDANGRSKIVPILTAQNPAIVENLLEAERNAVREHLYTNLFQILVQNPQMTATEAMLRANEKGELLGPSGAKIQAGLSRAIERELGVIERKGAFARDAALEPPQSLAGRSYGVRFTSPLDRMRRQSEAIGAQRTLELALPLAQLDPSIMDNFDLDAMIELARDTNGAPMKIMKLKEERDAAREQRAQMQAAQQTAAMVEQGGKAVNEAAPAVANLAGLADMLGSGQQQPAGNAA